MRMLGASVAVALAFACWSVEASAATKLCLRSDPTIHHVPENPRFIVHRDRLARLELRAHRTGETAFTPRRGALLPYRVEILDEYWASVTVTAPPGTGIIDHAIVGASCRGVLYRVVAKPPRPSAAAPVRASQSADGEQLTLTVRDDRGAVAWTRVDWAYSARELERGRHGSRYLSGHVDRDVWFRVAPTAPLVFVRVVHFHPDGSETSWRGWIAREPALRVGDGVPPTSGAEPPRCDVTAPRPVPVDPQFFVRAFDTPRFAAVSATGAALDSAIEVELYRRAAIAVRAPEGTVFQLQRLPVAPTCDGVRWLRATADRSRDEAPAIVAGDNRGCSASVTLADPDTWGHLEVRTPTGVVEEQLASEATVTPISDYTNARRPVTITPIWAGGIRGTPFVGWVQAEPRCAGLAFGSDAPPPAPPLVVGPVMAPAPPAPPPPREHAWHAIAVLGAMFAALGALGALPCCKPAVPERSL